MVSLQELLHLLDDTPVIAEIHPVSCCYLPSDVVIYETAAELAWSFDIPDRTLPERALILQAAQEYRARFPHVDVNHNPFTSQINSILFDKFDEICELMLVQSQLAETIVDYSDWPDVIALMLIDGLNYADVQRWIDVHPEVNMAVVPCLVDCPTLTKIAFPRIIGDKPPAGRLFDRGYQRRLGFTYWSRKTNPLTDLLFQTITNVNAVADFSTILAAVEQEIGDCPEQKSYLQIVRTGLDGYAHHQKRRPPITVIVDTIMNEVLALTELLERIGCTARIHLTADHGILWRDEFEPEVVGRAPAGSASRSCEWHNLYQQDESGRRFLIDGRNFYSLNYPKLRRALRIDEQGVHGGISFQESIVPFLTKRVGDIC